MKTTTTRTRHHGLRGTLLAAALAAGSPTLGGCGGSGAPAASGNGAGTAAQPAAASPEGEKSGTQLWAENCSRCHYSQPPQRFSGNQWAAIVHHMRSRADLTGEEQRKITEFLQASH